MTKHIISISFLALFPGAVLLAQPLNRSTPDAMLKSAQEAESTGNPYAALEFYEDVYDETKDKAINVKIAKLNFELRDYQQAERQLSRIVLRDRKNEYTELKYWYAMALKHNGKYADAADMFNQYISEGQDKALVEASKREAAGCKIGMKAKQPENLTVNNIGKKANSPQTEASPSYSGGELYFTTLASKEIITLDGKEGDWYTKIYTATKAGQTAEFGAPTPLGTQVNREGWHQGNVSITPDGKTMYFTRVQMENNYLGESKIYFALKGSDGWGAA
ncbi:MAG: tetratricopeptide repeat protein, partial [Thermoanaerobaculia bacterium]|nr:tetratricopeptide repeat protein [Thermoanaerobaculia bacterium]